MEYKAQLEAYREAVESYLQLCFTEDVPQNTLLDAMRYSLLAGGKRIRPVLTMEFCRLCCGDWQRAVPFGAAVEMLHTYSLIHDDLPCMDNDDYRRGRLTNHKVYGETVAVLAGDALLTAAFETLSRAGDAKASLLAVQILSRSAGELGMVGGQVLDTISENKALSAEEVHVIHRLKTGCLISAACQIGVAAGNGTEEQMTAARTFAESLGLAFQIRDDMLDVLGDAEKLGKRTNMDEHKTTFVTLYGTEGCRERIDRENQKAISALSVFKDAPFLTELAHSLAIRDY